MGGAHEALVTAMSQVISEGLDQRGWTPQEAERHVAGLKWRSIYRVRNGQREVTVTELIAFADAFGEDPGDLLARARVRAERLASIGTGIPDPRGLIEHLIAHPEDDAELNTRLSDVASQSGASAARLRDVRETIRKQRNEELTRALSALPPSEA